jgi:sortase A
MPSRVFLFLLIPLIGLAVLTSPAILEPLLQREATATPAPDAPTVTVTPTPTQDPFADLPLATPWSSGASAPYPSPVPALGQLSPGLTATSPPAGLSSDSPTSPPLTASFKIDVQEKDSVDAGIPPVPTPAGRPPQRLVIARLNLDAPVEPVGMVSSNVAPGVVEWDVPDHRAAGWLNTSAAFGLAGNTVLDGHHNIKGEVFRNLWTLQAGDEIRLYAGGESRSYRVDEVLLLPEKDQPLAVRLANARYIQPTNDERLTLITCWPYENNTHRVVVVAKPMNVMEQ